MPLQDKAAIVEKHAANGPVLVYCDKSMNEELTKLGLEVLIVDNQVEHQRLRELDQQVNGKYTVVIANDKSAMRGIDYRSETVKMTMVFAKPFENMREAMQGYHRVGRFGDACQRVQFKDVPLIDIKAETQYKQSAFKFISAMQAKKVQVKAIAAKQIIVPAAKPNVVPKYQSTKLGQKRTNAMLTQAAA